MKPFTLDDVISLEDYAAGRLEFFAAHIRYRDRYRRVRLGPKLTIVFENRQTLWFRMQEVIRTARLVERDAVQEHLTHYSRLLPQRNQLHASLLIEVDESRWSDEAKFWSGLQGDHIQLVLGDTRISSCLVTSRPEDRAVGAAHWVEFALSAQDQVALADFERPAKLETIYPAYEYVSSALSEDVRQSLLEDLAASQRDLAA